MRIRDFIDKMEDQGWSLSQESKEEILKETIIDYMSENNAKLIFLKAISRIETRVIEINSLSIDGFPIWLNSKTNI